MREFVVAAGGITVAGSTTLVFINPNAAPAVNIEFLRYWVGQSANATSAQQRIQIETQVSAFGTFTSATPTARKPADTNASFITGGTNGAAGKAGTNCSAEGAGAISTDWEDAFNVLNGYLQVPTPPETKIMPAGSVSGLGLKFPVSPATLTNWACGICFREV